jgi:hypothetical protein
MMRCERCDVEVQIGYDSPDAQSANAEIRLQEVQTGYGVTTFLCYDCRKAWNRFSATNDLFKEYTLAGFRLRCWEARWRRKPGDDIAMKQGESLILTLTELDAKLLVLTENWVKAGPPKAERATLRPYSDQDDE